MKSIDLCVFYITARKFDVKLEENPELMVCYRCRGYNLNCSKQLLVKVDGLEYRLLKGVKK